MTMFEQEFNKKVCLSIAGLDPSGGAGILADVKVFSALGCFGTAAVTSVTFQNTVGVFGAVHQTPESVRQQLLPIIDDLGVAAAKTGMLPTAEIIETVAEIAVEKGIVQLIVDPVVRSTSGFDLIDDLALQSLIAKLFPLALIITPNLAEAERITGTVIKSIEDIDRAAEIMTDLGARNILIKGGHHFAGGDVVSNKAIDRAYLNGERREFSAEFIDTTSTHGTGCVLSAAITAYIALGQPLEHAIGSAKALVTNAIRTAPNLGKGHSPINI